MNARTLSRASHMLAAFAALAAIGCRSYEPAPLDLDATRRHWLERSPSDESARQFAERLFRTENIADSLVFDPSDGLSLPEGEAVALVFNRELRVARLEADVARATRDFAGRWEDPVAGVDIERIISGVDEPWVVAGTIGLTIPISGRLDAAKTLARVEHTEALQALAAEEWATRAALRERWIEWSAQLQRVRVSADVHDRLNEIVSLVERQHEAGEISRVDARLFRVQLISSEADLISARARVYELELQLRGLLGLSPEAPVQLLETLTFDAPALDADAARAAMETRNLELASVRAAYDAAEAALNLEIRKQYPDLTIGPGFGEDQGDERVLLGLRMPIPLWNQNAQGVAEAAAEREAARARFDSEYERLALELQVASARLDAALEVRHTVESTLIPLADEQEADARRIAELGEFDPLLILQSLIAQRDAKARLIDARAAESIGAVRRSFLIGPPPSVAPPVEGAQP